jgi:hypothetical protein
MFVKNCRGVCAERSIATASSALHPPVAAIIAGARRHRRQPAPLLSRVNWSLGQWLETTH